ncbi:MAG TPA: hypothetical protein VNA13_04860 [Xanthomonadales bacterium]|nr:hypothetical protein [Xanthomonadales bacterium]
MTRIVIKKLVWDEYNLEHIKKHKVVQSEVEEIAKNIKAHKKAKKGRYLIIGRSGSRILSIVINRKEKGIYYPVTARDSDKDERKIIYEKEKK